MEIVQGAAGNVDSDWKSLTASDAEPHGLLRIGLSHPLAERTLIDPILALTEKYPKVRLRLLSELTVELYRRLLAGELDVAVVLLPEESRQSTLGAQSGRMPASGRTPRSDGA